MLMAIYSTRDRRLALTAAFALLLAIGVILWLAV